MIIDFHSHLVPEYVRTLQKDAPERDWHGITVSTNGEGRVLHTVGDHSGWLTHPPGQTVEDRIRDMDARGIDMQVISMSPSLVQYRSSPSDAIACAREVNDEWASLSRTWPNRIAAFAHLPLQDSDAAIAEMERAMHGLGLIGVCLPTHVNGANWDEEALIPILAAAEHLGALVFFHPIQIRVRDLAPRHHLRNFLGNPWETAVTIGSLVFGGVLDKHPRLRAIFAHGGGFAPYAMGRFDHGYAARPDAKGATQLPSSYLKQLTYDCITHDDRALRYLIDAVGSERIVLGTDYPADMSSANPVQAIRDSQLLSEDEKDRILAINGEQLLERQRQTQ